MTPLEKFKAEMIEAHNKFIDGKSIVVSHQLFDAGAAKALRSSAVRELCETLGRLTKVGPPSVPTTGAELASQCLKDNCEIAAKALTNFNEILKGLGEP